MRRGRMRTDQRRAFQITVNSRAGESHRHQGNSVAAAIERGKWTVPVSRGQQAAVQLLISM